MKFGTVAILGCPNVGKSTLINTLVHHKIAIVSDKPQTTRSRILGVAHGPQGQLALLDTPGIHKPRRRLNARMVRAAVGAMEDADVLAVMVDGSRTPGTGDRFVADAVFARAAQTGDVPVVLLVNKIDILNRVKMLPVLEAYHALGAWTAVVPVSAKTGLNIDRLLEVLFAHVDEHDDGAFDDDFITDQSWRLLTAETIREKVIHATRAELPYAAAVTVDEFQEDGPVTRIAASIVVERSGQKAIIIGKAGACLKAIGTAARLELSQAMRRKIFLSLHVKVKAAWADDDRMLAELGY